MADITDPRRVHSMTKSEGKGEVSELKGLLARDEDFVRVAVEAVGTGRTRCGDEREAYAGFAALALRDFEIGFGSEQL